MVRTHSRSAYADAGLHVSPVPHVDRRLDVYCTHPHTRTHAHTYARTHARTPTRAFAQTHAHAHAPARKHPHSHTYTSTTCPEGFRYEMVFPLSYSRCNGVTYTAVALHFAMVAIDCETTSSRIITIARLHLAGSMWILNTSSRPVAVSRSCHHFRPLTSSRGRFTTTCRCLPAVSSLPVVSSLSAVDGHALRDVTAPLKCRLRHAARRRRRRRLKAAACPPHNSPPRRRLPFRVPPLYI